MASATATPAILEAPVRSVRSAPVCAMPPRACVTMESVCAAVVGQGHHVDNPLAVPETVPAMVSVIGASAFVILLTLATTVP